MKILIINDPQTAVANVLAGEVQFVTNFTFSVDQGQVLEQTWAANGGGTVLYSPTQRRLGLIQMRPENQQPKALSDVKEELRSRLANDSVFKERENYLATLRKTAQIDEKL